MYRWDCYFYFLFFEKQHCNLIQIEAESAWIIEKRCRRTPSIHTEYSLICFVCLAMLCTVQFFCLNTWMNSIYVKSLASSFASSIKCPYSVKDGFSLARASVVILESPSSTTKSRPSSFAKRKASLAATTSTAVAKKGSGNVLAIDTTTCPFQYRIITPTPAWLSSLKTMPSKFTLWFGQGGSVHLRLWQVFMTLSGGLGATERRKAVPVLQTSSMMHQIRNNRLLVRITFLWYHTVQTMVVKRAKSASTSITCSTISLKLMKSVDARKLHAKFCDHSGVSVGQDHRACTTSSVSTWHCSQMSWVSISAWD